MNSALVARFATLLTLAPDLLLAGGAWDGPASTSLPPQSDICPMFRPAENDPFPNRCWSWEVGGEHLRVLRPDSRELPRVPWVERVQEAMQKLESVFAPEQVALLRAASIELVIEPRLTRTGLRAFQDMGPRGEVSVFLSPALVVGTRESDRQLRLALVHEFQHALRDLIALRSTAQPTETWFDEGVSLEFEARAGADFSAEFEAFATEPLPLLDASAWRVKSTARERSARYALTRLLTERVTRVLGSGILTREQAPSPTEVARAEGGADASPEDWVARFYLEILRTHSPLAAKIPPHPRGEGFVADLTLGPWDASLLAVPPSARAIAFFSIQPTVRFLVLGPSGEIFRQVDLERVIDPRDGTLNFQLPQSSDSRDFRVLVFGDAGTKVPSTPLRVRITAR